MPRTLGRAPRAATRAKAALAKHARSGARRPLTHFAVSRETRVGKVSNPLANRTEGGVEGSRTRSTSKGPRAASRLAARTRDPATRRSAIPGALTALQAVRDAGKVGPGTRVLINGASGGVGSFAVQIARHLGAEVIGVSSARNAELVRALGADHHIDYASEDFAAKGRQFDVIIDNVGNRSLSELRAALVEDGILVMVTGPKQNDWFGPLLRMLGARLSAPFVKQTQLTLFAESNQADLETLRDLLEAGSLRAVIDRRFSLAEVPDAIDYLEQGRTRGKNVVRIVPEPDAP